MPSPIEMNDLGGLEARLEVEIAALRYAADLGLHNGAEDFNVRGKLYAIAGDIAPRAREQDLVHLGQWLRPQSGEIGGDIAAGTGFATLPLARHTNARTYAIDPSSVQLEALQARNQEGLPIITIEGSLADDEVRGLFGDDAGNIDYFTSFGGLHHIVDTPMPDGRIQNDQQLTFQRVSDLLRPGGRFVAADVGGGSSLANHFEASVKHHCLTGHVEKWLTPERLQGELIEGTELSFVAAETIPVGMEFDSKRHMALFMKGLHAYDLPTDQIIDDLGSTLGFTARPDGSVHLNWPLLFFHLEKRA